MPSPRSAFPQAGPFTLLALRYSIAVLVLLPLVSLPQPDFPKGRLALDITVIGFLIQHAVGAVFTLPLTLATEGLQADWTSELFATLAYLVIGNSLISITLLLAMICAGEVVRVSALFYLVPPLSALFAWPLLGEAMPPLAWAGMALAGIGVTLARR